MTSAISLGDLITIITFVVGVITAVLKLQGRTDSKVEAVRKEFEEKLMPVTKRLERHSCQLNAYKLEATEKYASVEHLKEVESRLLISMERLTDRIDRLISHIDKQASKKESK